MSAQPSQPAPLLWSVDEAAARLGISRATLYELLASRQLASLKSAPGGSSPTPSAAGSLRPGWPRAASGHEQVRP